MKPTFLKYFFSVLFLLLFQGLGKGEVFSGFWKELEELTAAKNHVNTLPSTGLALVELDKAKAMATQTTALLPSKMVELIKGYSEGSDFVVEMNKIQGFYIKAAIDARSAGKMDDAAAFYAALEQVRKYRKLHVGDAVTDLNLFLTDLASNQHMLDFFLNAADDATRLKYAKAWELAIGKPLMRKDILFLEKLEELMDPIFIQKLPNGQSDLDAIITALKHPCCGEPHSFMKSVADHLDDIKYTVNNFHGVTGFDKVVSALKHPLFTVQDGTSHMLSKLRTLDPNIVHRFEGTIVEGLADADDLSAICVLCKFDIELEISPGVFKKLELKSYSETTISNISNSTPFKNQFKAYLVEANGINDFDYIFNAQKTTNETLIKQNFRTIFAKNNYDIFDQIGDADNLLMQSLGITSKSDFIDAVDNLEDSLYNFIKIE